MSDNENLLSKTNLKQLRLPTMKAECDKLAKEASSENGRIRVIITDPCLSASHNG